VAKRREGDLGGEFVKEGLVCKDCLSDYEIYPDNNDLMYNEIPDGVNLKLPLLLHAP